MFNFPKTPMTYSNDPDVKAMLEVKAGDSKAFQLVLDLHYQRVYHFCYRFFNAQGALAQDLTQETFLKLFEMAPRYEPRAKVSTLLFQIARNLCLNQARRPKTVSLDQPLAHEEGFVTMQVPDRQSSDAQEHLLQEELAQAVRRAIEDLPEHQRMAILLARFENMSYEDIAHSMQTSVKAVKSLLNRAKENLAVTLKKFGPFEENAELFKD